MIGMVHDLKLRKRNRMLARAGGASVMALLVVTVAIIYWSSPAAPLVQDYGGLTCREVVARFDDYYAKRVDPEMAARIQLHLTNCPKCGPHYLEFIESRQSTAGKTSYHTVLASASSGCPSRRHRSAYTGCVSKSPGHTRRTSILLARLR